MSKSDNIGNANAIWEILHKQADIVRDQGAVLAETKAEVKGLGGQLRDFIDAYREGQAHVMSAIEQMAKPKANNVWQIVGVCLVILGMFGTVMIKTVTDSKEVAQLKFEHAREVGDLRFNHANTATAQQQIELKALFTRQEGFIKDMQQMAFEGGKQMQKLEDLTLFSRRMDTELQTRMLAAETRINEGAVSTAVNTTAIRAFGEYTKEHVNRSGAAGHPNPQTDVRVKEQPHVGIPP